MLDFENFDDQAAASWLADVSGYLRARIALAQEYESLDATRQSVPFVWLDRMVGTADDLAALEQWRFVAHVSGEMPGAAGMRIVGTGDTLDAPLRSWLRGNAAPLDEELAPGQLAARTGGDLGSSVLVGADQLSVAWFVTGELSVEAMREHRASRPEWEAIADWAARHGATPTELGRTPAAAAGVDHVSFRLAGDDRKERLLDTLELYGELGVERPRDDVIAAFMNHDMGAIGVRVACGDVGIVEIGVTAETAHHPALVLILDELGPTAMEHVARLQGVMDSEPARLVAVLGQRGHGVELQYDLSAYHAVD